MSRQNSRADSIVLQSLPTSDPDVRLLVAGPAGIDHQVIDESGNSILDFMFADRAQVEKMSASLGGNLRLRDLVAVSPVALARPEAPGAIPGFVHLDLPQKAVQAATGRDVVEIDGDRPGLEGSNLFFYLDEDLELLGIALSPTDGQLSVFSVDKSVTPGNLGGTVIEPLLSSDMANVILPRTTSFDIAISVTDRAAFAEFLGLEDLDRAKDRDLDGRLQHVFLIPDPDNGPTGAEITRVFSSRDGARISIEVEANVTDRMALTRSARKARSGWGEGDWVPGMDGGDPVQEALWEIYCASNINPSPDEIGFAFEAQVTNLDQDVGETMAPSM